MLKARLLPYIFRNKSNADIDIFIFLYLSIGNMTSDYDRNIVTIRYNILNLPDTIQFSTGNQIINRYSASRWLSGGQKPGDGVFYTGN